MDYIETPVKQYKQPVKGGKGSKMSQSIKTSAPEAQKASKSKYAKTRGEHTKDIVIAILVSGVIAFIGGMTFQTRQQDAINTAVKGASVTAPVTPVKK